MITDIVFIPDSLDRKVTERPSRGTRIKSFFDLIVAGAGALSIIFIVLHYALGLPLFRDATASLQDRYNHDAAEMVEQAERIEKTHLKEFTTQEGIANVVSGEVNGGNMLPKLITAANTLNEIALCHESWTCTIDNYAYYESAITEFWGTYRSVLLPLRKDEPPGFCAALERETKRIVRSWGL